MLQMIMYIHFINIFLNDRKPKMKDPDYPQCHTETINDRPAYMCERTVDGEKKKFGIKFDRTNSLLCGEFESGQLNGYGYGLHSGEEDTQRMYCGNLVQDLLDGPSSVYFFVTKGLEIANVTVCKIFGTL